tara:strand:- start:272 stop:487 length:216 start_codon:yes stop_codon:yes gene_type:complete
MSQEELSNFLYSIEHSFSLRSELKECKDDKIILNMAKKYGFNLSQEDLTENITSEEIETWFKKSKFNSIKK